MSKLVHALNSATTTHNDAPAYVSTMDSVVDLFFKIGASRGRFKDLVPIISRSAVDNLDWTIRVLLYSRDAREGQGERQIFKDAIPLLFKLNLINEEIGNRIADRVPDLGRWDDLLAFIGTPSENHALQMIMTALANKDGLCAKWMPREKNNPTIARKLIQYMDLNPRIYRRMLARLSSTVEDKMCANQWTDIEYEKVPSLASARYQKAFGRHDPVGYGKYITSLEKGEAKINAGAVYPYDIVKSVRHGNSKVADAQWLALPDYLNGDSSRTLVVVDTSGSMGDWNFYRYGRDRNPPPGNFTPMDIALSLALYLSERMKGVFKDCVMSFNTVPQLLTLKGNLTNRVNQLQRMSVGSNTNLERVFKTILSKAVEYKLNEEDMPERVLILSDMQFDQAVATPNLTLQKTIEEAYVAHGYKIPQIVYWNINNYDNVPVEFDKRGTALVSGFSPSIMKGILSADMDSFTPLNVMKKAILVDRYNY